MRLNCILQDLFRDTPLDHIWHAQIRAQICQIWSNIPNMLNKLGLCLSATVQQIPTVNIFMVVRTQEVKEKAKNIEKKWQDFG